MSRDTFLEFLREQMAPLGHLTLRPMFGMVGVFCDGVMLGIAGDGVLYLRVDDGNRTAFAEAAGDALRYQKKGNTIELAFWRAPERLYDDPDELLEWSQLALAAAVRVAGARRHAGAKARFRPRS